MSCFANLGPETDTNTEWNVKNYVGCILIFKRIAFSGVELEDKMHTNRSV